MPNNNKKTTIAKHANENENEATPCTSNDGQAQNWLRSPILGRNFVKLENDGEFGEGQAYMIRDKNGNSRKMIYKSGAFVPLEDVVKANRRVNPAHGTQCLAKPLKRRSKEKKHETTPCSSNNRQAQDWLRGPILEINIVKLDDGGDFEEGQAYMIRDKHGNSRKMIFKSGAFVPLEDDVTGNRRVNPAHGKQCLAKPLKRRSKANEHEAIPCSSNIGQAQDWLRGPILERNLVKLDDGGEFGEGQSYMIRDKHGHSRKMIFKSGAFVPLEDDLTGNRRVNPAHGKQCLAKPLKRRAKANEHEAIPCPSNNGQAQDWLRGPILERNIVKLGDGGDFGEGQAYMIRDKHGNSRKMIFKSGAFVPLEDDEKDMSMHQGPGRQPLAKRLKRRSAQMKDTCRTSNQQNAPESRAAASYSISLSSSSVPSNESKAASVILPDGQTVNLEIEKLQEQRECKICMEKDVCVTFLPCRHLATCEDCAGTLTECPICRAPVEDKMHVYWS